MSEELTQQKQLDAHFGDDLIKQVQGLDYVPVGEVVNRMNKVLGTGNWSSRIVSISESRDYVIAVVSVSAVIDGVTCIAEAPGGSQISKRRDGSGLVDLGKDYKSAYSDALKKACQRLGVGLHLAIHEEEEMPEDPNPAIGYDRWNKMMDFLKNLPEEKKQNAQSWWEQNGNGKLDYATMTPTLMDEFGKHVQSLMKDDADEAVEAVQSELGGELVGASEPF